MSVRRKRLLIALAAVGLGLTVTGAQAETKPPTPDPGWHQITLVGMVLRQVGPSFAVIHDPLTGKTEFYPLGAAVKGARLSRILSDRIVLTEGNTRLVLRLGVAGARPAGGADESAASSSADRAHAEGPRGRSLTLAAAQGADRTRAASHIVRPAGRKDGSETGGAATGGDGGTSDTESSANGASGPSAQLRISGLHHDGAVKVQSQFTANDLRDLHLDVDYAQVSGSHRQRLELYGPDGMLYQRRFLDMSVTAGQPIQTRIPVGGTWITDHSLFGNWRVLVYLDSSQTPIATGAFALNP